MSKILVIDDDVDNLIAMKDAIESCIEDCSVLTAQSGIEGLELARKELPDTIILDIVMPGIDGYEVCIQLKGDLATKHIPVILLSAIRKDTESKLKGYEAGADIFLTKPIESEILFEKIKEMLHIKEKGDGLDQSEDHYRMLFNSIDEGFCIIEVIFDKNEKPIDYRFLEVNPSFENQTGLINAKGKRMRELAPKHEDHWFEMYGKIALTGESARFENHAAQLHRWYNVYAFRYGQPENRQVAILFNDITIRKQNEEKLIEKSFVLSESIKELNCIYEVTTLLDVQNVSLEDIMQQVVNLIPYSWQYPKITVSRVTINDKDYTTKNFRQTEWRQSRDIWVNDEKIGNIEIDYLEKKPDCDEGPFLEGERNLLNLIAERLGHFIEHKNAKEALEQNRDYINNIINSMLESLVVINWDGNIQLANESTYSLLGYNEAELIGKPISILFSEEDELFRALDIGEILKKGNIGNIETNYLTKDGCSIPILFSCSYIRSVDRKILGIVCVANDVTKLRNAEKALKESEELNRKMIESSYDCIILVDLEGNLKFISEGGKKLMEIDESSTMLHTPWMNLWEGSVHDSALEAISQAKQGLVGKFHGYYTTQKNTHKYWDVIISPICDNNGKVVELLSISRDVTKNKLAEEQIEKELKENKLLLSEIHHRIKNNLQIISSLLQLQQAEMKTKEGVFKGFAASQGRIQAMARAYELLLQSKYMVDVNLGEYIESLTQQIKNSFDIHNKVTISYSMDEIELGIVILDRLGLVLNEVITNAIQYAFTDRDSGNIHIELNDAGENFKIMISDDGIGIPKEFTLHDATTLGLSIIDMITQQLLGTVELVRENGTSFSFTFPKKPEVYLER